MISTLYFRFGTDDAYGCTKIPVREARQFDISNEQDMSVRSIVSGVEGPYRDIPVVGTNRYCVIVDFSDLHIPLGAHCVLISNGGGRYTVLCC
jgi:hypothetical protein